MTLREEIFEEVEKAVLSNTSINEATDSILQAIKDELMRVMPEEDLRGKNIDNIPDYQLGKLSGWNYYRSQMISAITKICEEGKCTN